MHAGHGIDWLKKDKTLYKSTSKGVMATLKTKRCSACLFRKELTKKEIKELRATNLPSHKIKNLIDRGYCAYGHKMKYGVIKCKQFIYATEILKKAIKK